MKLVIYGLWCGCLFLQSCATILRGPSQEITVQSNIPDAEVYMNGEKKCDSTPCKFKVSRKMRNVMYTIRREGYYDFAFRDESKARWDLLFYVDLVSGVYPFFLDFAIGANRTFNNDKIFADLKSKEVIKEKEYIYVGAAATAYEFKRTSDVDKNIPANNEKRPLCFAVIIGNEDYASQQKSLTTEANVDFARNDASAFKEYAVKTLGIPEKNIIFELDATAGKMNQALSKINLLCKNTGGQAEVFFYYAGHGLPDETTKEAYLIPVDVNGANVTAGIKLAEVYNKLTEYPSKKVVAFIDACFSGGARNKGLLSARGIQINPKSEKTHGNLVVFTASSDEQSSLPFKEKEHGMFTYYLLKKFQESGADVTLKELYGYLKEKISVESLLTNDKEQTPQAIFSSEIEHDWEDWRLK